MKHILCLAAAIFLSSCALFDNDADDCAGLTARLDRLEVQVSNAISNAEASDVASCRTVAFGDKPCGGPWSYLVYSTEASDTAEVQRLVGEYNRLDRQRNAACGLASDCMIAPMPAAVLEAGRCVADFGGD